MDWESKQDVTFDYSVHNHGDDKITAVITQLVELANLISNHLGSNIDPNVKPTTPSQKKIKKVGFGTNDVKDNTSSLGNRTIHGLATPVGQPKVIKEFIKTRKETKDYTGRSISKEETDNEENANPLMAGAFVGGVARETGGEMLADLFTDENIDDTKKQMNALSTSEGKALVSTLQEAAKLLNKFLNTTRVDSGTALKPQDMKR